MAVNPTTQNISLRIQNALQRPLMQRCIEIEEIIKSTSLKELQHLLPQLLENIFGFGPEAGWNLDLITRQQHPYDFDVIRKFLSPDGVLFNMIYNLQADIYLTYEFPFNCLPAPTRHLVEEGGVTLFLVNKLQYQNFGRPVLSLSAFEYYMFHFTYCLVNPHWQRRTMNWSNLNDCLYPCLLDDYLHYFLPINKKSVPPLPHVPSPVRSPVVHSAMSGKPSPGSPAAPRTPPRLSLFKSSFMSSQKQHVQSTPVLDQGETETWRSETLLQVLVEFWLNQNSLNMEKSFISGHPLENFLPSNNHVRLVRMLVKHLHYFVNSATSDVTSPYQTQTVVPLDELKKSVFPQTVQKKLYTFLRHAFERWPLDSSFRLIVETWLTYLQPWRYTDPSHRLRFSNQHQVELESRDKHVDDKWLSFIEENILFFTVLFQKFLQRVYRMDLMSTMSAYMLYRVTKVLSLPDLPMLLQKAEGSLFGTMYHHLNGRQDLGASYITPDLTMIMNTQITELEHPGFQYNLLYGETTLTDAKQVMDLAARAKTTINNAQSTVRPQKSKLAALFDFSSWFEDSSKVFGDMSMTEVKRLTTHLEHIIKNICTIFQLDPPIYSPDVTRGFSQFDESSFASQTTAPSEPSTPDCEETENGFELTPLGRYQLMNNSKKFDTFYHGDPDLQPIRSFEIATLVRVLHKLCSHINKQFYLEIQQMYSREDMIGRMARVYFAPPLTANSVIKSPLSKSMKKQLEVPRLSLRFLANYRTLIYLGIFYVFLSYMWGFGPVSFILFMSFSVLVYGFVRALSQPSHLKTS